MWCRFLTFCILVTLILFIVLSCIYKRPVLHLFFHRCCGDDIENDQVIFENFGNNFLRERLIDNTTYVYEDFMINTHDPKSREVLESIENYKDVYSEIEFSTDKDYNKTNVNE